MSVPIQSVTWAIAFALVAGGFTTAAIGAPGTDASSSPEEATPIADESATAAPKGTRLWSAGTALSLPKDRVEFGLFHPVRWGLTDDIDLESNLQFIWAVPSLTVKVSWIQEDDWALATEHTLASPTPILHILAREGVGGFVPFSADIPVILTLTNRLLISAIHHEDHIVTGRAALHLGVAFGPNTLPTLDMPIVYPRQATWHDTIAGELAISFEGPIYGPLAYLVDATLWLLPDAKATVHFEQSTRLMLNVSDGFGITAGMQWVWGQYPFGDQFDVLPVVDLRWGFGG